MRTVGVDLAAEPTTTAIAAIDWHADGAQVTAVEVRVEDEDVLRHAQAADKIGIDCPLGWPSRFVSFVTDHHKGAVMDYPDGSPADWRRTLAYRLTDDAVRYDLGMVPLSVATDRIGLTAMRAARLQSLLIKEGHPVDRIGAGLIVEVYPAAGLKKWGLHHRKYKGKKNSAVLGELVAHLRDKLPGLDLGEHEALCRRSDHALDAVVSALLARAVLLGHTKQPTAHDLPLAVREGWIAIPTCSLDALMP